MFKSSGVDRVILAINAEKGYNVNETIEFVKELSSVNSYKILFFIDIQELVILFPYSIILLL